MMYCSVDDVKFITNIQSKHWFKSEEDPESSLNTLLTSWIELSSSAVSNFCDTAWEDSKVPSPVRLATMLYVSNIVAFAQTRRDTPTLSQTDWNKVFSDVNLMTQDIKDLLEPYVETSETKGINAYCIAGDDEEQFI